MGRPKGTKYIETPEKLWELFIEYSKHENEPSISGFRLSVKKSLNISLDQYFTNRRNGYSEYISIVNDIKQYIFQHKLKLYKDGKLKPCKIVRELSDRGINIYESKFILRKTFANNEDLPFEVSNNKLSIKDSYLTKQTEQSKRIINNKNPDELYVINVKGTNIYKIGVSQNSKRRIFDIRASNPFPIDVVVLKKMIFPLQLERKIHNSLNKCHIKNEWFKIDKIDNILNMINNG